MSQLIQKRKKACSVAGSVLKKSPLTQVKGSFFVLFFCDNLTTPSKKMPSKIRQNGRRPSVIFTRKSKMDERFLGGIGGNFPTDKLICRHEVASKYRACQTPLCMLMYNKIWKLGVRSYGSESKKKTTDFFSSERQGV